MWALIVAPVLVAGLSLAAAAPAAAHSHRGQTIHWVQPNAVNNLDCNGWSPKYKSIDPAHRALCTDPLGPRSYQGDTASARYGRDGRLLDNGHYVGHDEPSVKFISNAAKSGNTFTYYMRVPADPKKPPTNNLTVTDYAELSIAPWFGLPICDPLSYPQSPCKPDSNSNASGISNPKDAGSAFMELQFYPPGVTPFEDTFSCSATKWCAAITIDSLESKFNFKDLNPNCEEPINFAYLQTNGVPAGPPSPQLADNASNIPNAHTLEMSAGDILKVSVTDPPSGITTTVDDLTTGKTGFMAASAKNGFMDTNYKTCAGRPFTFHAEFATAAPQNRVPWAALEGGVLMEQEIGHGEICNALSSHDAEDITYAEKGQTFADNKVYDTCNGGAGEGKASPGEGPCSLVTAICVNPTTEGKTEPAACPSDSYVSGDLCEYADGFCFPKGSRTVLINGVKTKQTSIINICFNNRFQNGDLDYDGTSYQPDTWPNGSPDHPQSIRYIGPFSANGKPYPQIQIETDGPQSASLCDIHTGANCRVPMYGADFYPYWTLTSKQPLKPGMFPKGACVWNFGNTIKNITTNNLGGDKEYGKRDPLWFGGTFITPKPVPNPEVTHGCPSLSIKG